MDALRWFSLREVFGFLVPGFTWLTGSCVLFPSVASALSKFKLFNDEVFLYINILLFSYLLGWVTVYVAFLFLSKLSKLIVIGSQGVNHTIAAATVSRIQAIAPSSSSQQERQICKDYVLEHSEIHRHTLLAKEAEINLSAGMALPLIFLGVLALIIKCSWVVSLALLILGLFCVKRFYELRDDEFRSTVCLFEIVSHRYLQGSKGATGQQES